jgi:hypothetical protein
LPASDLADPSDWDETDVDSDCSVASDESITTECRKHYLYGYGIKPDLSGCHLHVQQVLERNIAKLKHERATGYRNGKNAAPYVHSSQVKVHTRTTVAEEDSLVRPRDDRMCRTSPSRLPPRSFTPPAKTGTWTPSYDFTDQRVQSSLNFELRRCVVSSLGIWDCEFWNWSFWFFGF